MDRELALAALILAIGGPALLLGAAAWPKRHGEAVSARLWERTAWRALWTPLIPAVLIVSALCGWVILEPSDAELLPWSICSLGLVFAAIWLRAIVRAVKTALWLPASLAAGTVGLVRPRIIISANLVDQLDPVGLVAVRAHETAHVEHLDPLRIWLAQLATDLQWPCVTAQRRFDEWRRVLELARDEEARRAGVDGADLAAAVLAALRIQSTGSALTASLGTSSGLQHRIARLLAPLPEDEPKLMTRLALPLAPMCLLSAISGARFGEAFVQMMVQVLP